MSTSKLVAASLGLKYIILDLPAYVEKCNKADSREHLWLYLLANAGKESDLPDGGSDAIRRAIERITIANADEELLKSQEKYMIDQDENDCRIADSYLKGREQGRVQGREEERVDMFSAMDRIDNGDSVEDISKKLTLPLDVVKKLKNLLSK